MSRKIPNASEMGRIGGKKRAEQAGSEGMGEIAKLGKRSGKKSDPDFYKKIRAIGVAKQRERDKVKKSPVSQLTKILTGGE